MVASRRSLKQAASMRLFYQSFKFKSITFQGLDFNFGTILVFGSGSYYNVDETDSRPGRVGSVTLNLTFEGIAPSHFDLVGQEESATGLTRRLQQFGGDIQLTIDSKLITITNLPVLNRSSI